MTREHIAVVHKNRPLGGGYFVLTLRLPRSFSTPVPGAFAMLSVGNPGNILRRPMAFFDFQRRGKDVLVDVLYAVVGTGTNQIRNRKPGDEISLFGPIGNGFSSPRPKESVYVVAGGVGVAPFLFWAKNLSTAQKKKVKILFGFRDRSQMAIVKSFSRTGIKVLCAVEHDTPKGVFRGNSVDLLERTIEDQRPDRILTCGPDPMMKRVLEVAKRISVPCEASLEAKMGCGVGACLSCVTTFAPSRRAGGYALVCQDGPVFTIQP